MALETRLEPNFFSEAQCLSLGARTVAGIDEAGRGPLAGPVTAAAVVLNPDDIPFGLDDSKRMNRHQRELLYGEIVNRCSVSVAHAEVPEIDSMNILQATMLAMRRAAEGLPTTPEHLLIDGNRVPSGLPCAASAIVKGDRKSFSIAAASIVAKVTRDRLMRALALEHAEYGWERNSGYGTRHHLEALRSNGPTRHHRKSFAPVRDAYSSHLANLET